MKKKFLIILFFSIIMCFIIYKIFKIDHIYYLSLGEMYKDNYRYEYQDYVYDYLKKNDKKAILNKNFLRENLSINDFKKLIGSANESIVNGKKETITYSINKASFITLSLGNYDIEKMINDNRNTNINTIYKMIDKLFFEYEDIIIKLNKITDKKIIILSIFKSIECDEKCNDIYKYSYQKLSMLDKYNNVYIIDLYNVFDIDSRYLEKTDIYSPSIFGYKYISNEIIKMYNYIN